MTFPRNLSLTRWDWGVLLWLACSRLALIAAVFPDRARIFNGDSPLYEGLALSMLAGEGYLFAPFEPYSDLIRPPGFPGFIYLNYLLFGPSPLAPILWNVLFVGLVYVGVSVLLREMGQRPHRAVGVVLGLDLAWLLYSKELLTEPLFTAMLLGALVMLLRGVASNRLALLGGGGVLVGLSALVKPIALYMPLVLVPWLVGAGVSRGWRPGRVAAGAALLLVGALLMVSPWMARNAVVHGTPTFTSIQAGNLLGGHAAFVWADARGLTHVEAQVELAARVDERLAAQHGTAAAAPYAALQEARAAAARAVLVEHPVRYVRAILRGVAVTLFDPGRLVLNRSLGQQDMLEIGLTNTLARDGLVGTLGHLLREPPVQVLTLVAYLIFLFGVAAMAALGLPGAFRAAPAIAWLCLLVGGYLLVLGGPHGYARFRLYVFPFILVAVHFGAVALGTWWRARQDRRRALSSEP